MNLRQAHCHAHSRPELFACPRNEITPLKRQYENAALQRGGYYLPAQFSSFANTVAKGRSIQSEI